MMGGFGVGGIQTRMSRLQILFLFFNKITNLSDLLHYILKTSNSKKIVYWLRFTQQITINVLAVNLSSQGTLFMGEWQWKEKIMLLRRESVRKAQKVFAHRQRHKTFIPNQSWEFHCNLDNEYI